MAGTKIGGQKAAATNIQRYGAGFYKNIGRIGGKESGKILGRGGFHKDRALAKRAGIIGGRMSSRSLTR